MQAAGGGLFIALEVVMQWLQGLSILDTTVYSEDLAHRRGSWRHFKSACMQLLFCVVHISTWFKYLSSLQMQAGSSCAVDIER